MKSIVITGGHHTAALPVIKELQKRHHEINIYWFGHKYTLAGSGNPTLEFQELTSLGIPFYNLHAGKFYKTFNPLRLIKIPIGFFQASYLLLKIRPEIILSFGGYLAVPVVLAGWILRIPSLTHEQTTMLGWANKLIAKVAVRILYTWPQSAKFFPKEKSKLVGLPLREEIFKSDSAHFSTNSDIPTIYITAGKTGSHVINTAIFKMLPELLMSFNIIHQTGGHSKYRDYEKLLHKYKEIEKDVKGKYHLRKFIYSDTIGEAFNKADFVMSRSGAHTCYELVALKKPAVLIPIPWVSHNEQYMNAKQVQEMGLGEIFEEKNVGKDEFFKFIINFSENIDSYQLKDNKDIIFDSAKRIVDEVQKVSNQKKN